MHFIIEETCCISLVAKATPHFNDAISHYIILVSTLNLCKHKKRKTCELTTHRIKLLKFTVYIIALSFLFFGLKLHLNLRREEEKNGIRRQ